MCGVSPVASAPILTDESPHPLSSMNSTTKLVGLPAAQGCSTTAQARRKLRINIAQKIIFLTLERRVLMMLLFAVCCAATLVVRPTLAYDVVDERNGITCQGTQGGQCSLSGQAGKTCYKCVPQGSGRDNNNPPPYKAGQNALDSFDGCKAHTKNYPQHYCAYENAYPDPNAPSPPPATTKTTTTSGKDCLVPSSFLLSFHSYEVLGVATIITTIPAVTFT